MLRRAVLTLLAAPFLRWRSVLAGTPAASPIAGAGDAAPIYEEAFRLVKQLGEAHRATLGGYTWASLDLTEEQIARLLEEARPIVEALRSAARLGDCRWEPVVITQDNLCQGRLDLGNRRAVDLLNLSARRHARAGDVRAMREDLDAALALTRRLGAGGVIIARVLEYSCEVRTWQALGRLMPLLGAAPCRDLAGWVAALPGPDPASAVVAPETRFVVDSMRAKLAAIGPTIDDDGWAELLIEAKHRPALARITRAEPARLLAHLEASTPAYDELARCLDLPRPDVWDALARFKAEQGMDHPIAAQLVEPFRGARRMRDGLVAYRALARAGLTLLGEGDAAFGALADPFGSDGAGFHRERRGRATYLRSALADPGHVAAELTIGEP